MNKELYLKMINLSKEQLIEWLIEEIEDNDRFKGLLNDLSKLGYCSKRNETRYDYYMTIYKFKDLTNEFFIAERIGESNEDKGSNKE